MKIEYSSAKKYEAFSGVMRKILANSKAIMLTEHTLEKGAVLPDHSHAHEQLVFLLSGRIKMEIGDQLIELNPRDSLVIPPNVKHNATALEKSVALDIFSPAREDYL